MVSPVAWGGRLQTIKQYLFYAVLRTLFFAQVVAPRSPRSSSQAAVVASCDPHDEDRKDVPRHCAVLWPKPGAGHASGAMLPTLDTSVPESKGAKALLRFFYTGMHFNRKTSNQWVLVYVPSSRGSNRTGRPR